jgi:hypothetical protein
MIKRTLASVLAPFLSAVVTNTLYSMGPSPPSALIFFPVVVYVCLELGALEGRPPLL